MIVDPYNTITETTSHDLWVEARKFEIGVSKSAPDTLTITINRPAIYEAIDGAVVLLSTSAIGPNEFPQDGKQYQNASTVWADPAADKIGAAQVIAFYQGVLQRPFPPGLTTAGDLFTGNKLEWNIEVTGVDPNTIYYASVHPSSQVLSYYPLGLQSYPTDVAVENPGIMAYAASIPQLPSAPMAPTIGMVYYDLQLNSVQYWDNTRSVWIPTRADQIISGEYNPGIPGMAYFVGSQLKVFNGKSWVKADSTNFQLRANGNWIPLFGTRASTSLPDAPTAGELVYNYTSQRVQYWDGGNWVVPDPTTTLFTTVNGLSPAFTAPFRIEPVDLLTPYPGLLFYNTTSRQLVVWNGGTWEVANTAQAGNSTQTKIGIGTDGTYDARLRLINIVKSQMGAPTLCLELTEEAFNIAVDDALQTYRQLCVSATENRFILFYLMPDQQIYFLNNPVQQTDRVVTVHKIHRLGIPGYAGAGPEDTWSQAFAQSYYNIAAGGGDLLSTHLLASWGDEFNRLFAGDLPFNWYESRRELVINRAIKGPQKVVLEVEMERTEQDLFQDRYAQQFLQGWAMAQLMYTLGLIRSKYSSGTPGASGNITLNGETLLAEANTMFNQLREQLLNYEFQDANHGNLSFLLA